jgi:hypothetical protein
MVPGAVAEAAMEETMPDAGAYRHIALFDAPGPLGG